MAKILEHFEFSKMGNRRTNYQEYLDGQIWVLTIDEDAPHLDKVEALRGSIRSAAIRQDLVMQSQILRKYLKDKNNQPTDELDERTSELVFRVYKVDEDGNEIEDWNEEDED